MTGHVATADTAAPLAGLDMTGRVVAGVDASPGAGAAALWAAHEAVLRGARLTVVHADAVGDGLLPATAARLRERFPGLRVDTAACDAAPAAALTALSRTAALLVVGTRGHGGFAGMLVGSVTRKLSLHARCPLVVVPDAAAAPDAGGEIVLGLGPRPAPAAARYAFEAARRHAAPLTVVRAWWPSATLTAIVAPGGARTAAFAAFREAANCDLEPPVAALRTEFPDVRAGTAIVEGNTVPALLDRADGARLLVVGVHRHRGPLSVGAGYVVDGVLGHARTPVAVVPES